MEVTDIITIIVCVAVVVAGMVFGHVQGKKIIELEKNNQLFPIKKSK